MFSGCSYVFPLQKCKGREAGFLAAERLLEVGEDRDGRGPSPIFCKTTPSRFLSATRDLALVSRTGPFPCFSKRLTVRPTIPLPGRVVESGKTSRGSAALVRGHVT